MNIQIVSNARNREGGENYNNVFTMPLPEEIDADNRRKTIRISYPQTIENVHENQCGIRIKYNFSRFLDGNPSSVKYRTP
jgi:c-di-GMP-binding flagellar brake protein YcgR